MSKAWEENLSDGVALTAETLSSINGIASVGNTSTTPLGADATFTGTGEQNSYGQVGVAVKTDVAGCMFFDFSNDGTNWDSTFPVAGFEVDAGISEFHTAVKLGRYFRVRFINKTDAQSYLRLYTYYGNNFVPASAPLNQIAGINQDAIFTRGSIPEDEIVLGRREGVRSVNKFATRSGISSAAGEVTAWAYTGANFVPMTTASTFTITYTNTADGVGGSATGALTLLLDYIDANGLPAEALHTLGSTGSDVTSFTGLGVNRVVVTSVRTAQYNVANITVTETTGGTVQAFVPAQKSVTQQSIFFVGSNHLAVAKFLSITALKVSGGGSPRVTVRGYAYNRNIGVRFQLFRTIIDTDVRNAATSTEPVGFGLSSTDVIYFTIQTNTNNTEIDIRFSLNEYRKT